MSKKIEVLFREVRLTVVNEQDYVCLTDIARYKNADASDDLIRNWLHNRNTLEFLGLWEQINNPGFNPVEFDGFRKQAGLNSFTLTPKQWIERTGATGIQSKAGRYGGTYAHLDIALEFAAWISVEFKLYLIKEFQRLKETERQTLGWDIRRFCDETTETWFFSVVDIVQVLTQQPDFQTARKYWNKLKERLAKGGSQLVTNCHRFKLAAEDGKQRLTDVAIAETLLRLVQSVPSPKAEPIKLWLARVGYERMQEMSDPALALSPKGALHASLGQHPRWTPTHQPQALKGRSNPCHNHSPAFTFTSFSARRAANASSPIPSAAHCTPTWPPSCKISAVLRSLSIPWMTTPTLSSILPGRPLSAKSSKMLKNPLPNGLNPKARDLPHLHGSRDTAHLRFQNPMWKPSANISPASANTTARKPSRRNTEHSSNATTSHSMNGMSGINPSPDQCPTAINPAPSGRPALAPTTKMPAQTGQPTRASAANSKAPTGQSTTAQGIALGLKTKSRTALKGRPNRCGLEIRPPLQGSAFFGWVPPGRCPGLPWTGALPLRRANGALPSQPGSTPWEPSTRRNQGLKARLNDCRCAVGPGFQPSRICDAITQGVALGWRRAGALPLRSAPL